MRFSLRLNDLIRWLVLSASISVATTCALGQQPTFVRQAVLNQVPEAIPSPGAGQLPLAGPVGQTPLTIPAQPTPPPDVTVLRLEDLEQMAMTNNPSVGRALAIVDAARGNW